MSEQRTDKPTSWREVNWRSVGKESLILLALVIVGGVVKAVIDGPKEDWKSKPIELKIKPTEPTSRR